MTNFRRALVALLTFVGISAGSLAVGMGVASAHANSVAGTKACQANGTWTVSWKVTNDFNLAETASLVSSTGGGTFAGFPLSIAAGNGQFATATQSGVTANSASVVVKGTWTDQFTTNNSGSINLTGNCPIQHQPVTLCHNGHLITIDDDAVVKQGHGSGNGEHANDIIPAFDYIGDDHLSHHFNAVGNQALLATGCTEAPHYDPIVERSETPCVSGDANVNITVTTHTFHAEFINGAWVKVEDQGSPVATHETRPLNEGELVTCIPTHEPKVEYGQWGGEEPKCGDTTQVQTRTKTTTVFSYTYENGAWVEHTTVTTVTQTRTVEVETEACPTTTTTEPPTTTTIPETTTTVPETTVPETTVPEITTTTVVAPTTPVTPTIPPNTPLPRTGSDNSGILLIGAICIGLGTLVIAAVRRRKTA